MTNAWEELALGTTAAARTYLAELFPAAAAALDQAAWAFKRQGALAVRSLAIHAGAAFGAYCGIALPTLVRGLSGRVWDGKEALLDAVPAVCHACKAELREGMQCVGVVRGFIGAQQGRRESHPRRSHKRC